jgi:TRAP-type transport system small permease protein
LGWGVTRAIHLLVERVFAPVAATCLAALMALTFIEVVWRYFLNSPLTGVEEIKSFLLGFTIFAALPLVTYRQRHIAVRSLAALLRGAARIAQQGLVLAGTTAGFAFVTYVLIDQARALAEDGTLTSYLDLEMAPFVYCFAAFTAVAALVALSAFARFCAGGHRDADAQAAGPE